MQFLTSKLDVPYYHMATLPFLIPARQQLAQPVSVIHPIQVQADKPVNQVRKDSSDVIDCGAKDADSSTKLVFSHLLHATRYNSSLL